VARVTAGDEAALRLLYQRYGRAAYGLVLRMLGDESSAQEVVQDLFVRVWWQAKGFDARRGRFSTWLLSIARNLAVDELRRRRARAWSAPPRQEPSPPALSEPADPDRAGDPAVAAELAALGVAVRAALATLPGEQRAAIELAYFEGLSQSEIAAATGIPLGTIKSRIRYGMQALQGRLATQGYGRGVGGETHA